MNCPNCGRKLKEKKGPPGWRILTCRCRSYSEVTFDPWLKITDRHDDLERQRWGPLQRTP